MKYRSWITTILFSAGSISLAYYAYLSLRYGFNFIVFSWSFFVIGMLLLGASLYEHHYKNQLCTLLPKVVRIPMYFLLMIAILCFIMIEGTIIYTGMQPSSDQSNTVIVLGAQLNGSSLSRLLRYRLDAALQFHEQYPQATIIVSGGQGAKEDCSEAKAMKAYLVAHGVDAALIQMEEESTNTQENFLFSKKLLKNDTHVSVITNDFHMFRSKYICEQSGLSCAVYPAQSDHDLAPNFYFREFFATVKDLILTKLQ